MSADETRERRAGVPASHWLNDRPTGRASKVTLAGRIGLVLWAAWLLCIWRQANRPDFESQAQWIWLQATTQVLFWLAVVCAAVWAAAVVFRDERTR